MRITTKKQLIMFVIACVSINALPAFADGEFYVIPVKKGDGHSLDAADGDPVDALYVDDIGNVGIGTNVPAYKLDIAGAARASGDLIVNGNAAIGSAATLSSATTLDVRGDTEEIYTGYFVNQYSGDSDSYGLYGEASGTNINDFHRTGVYGTAINGNFNFGVLGSASNSGATTNNGIAGIAQYGTTARGVEGSALNGVTNYGLHGIGRLGTTNYGVYAESTGNIGSTNYGVYGVASGGTYNYAGYFEGDVAYTGNLSDISDRRLKENIIPIDNALAKVEAINGVFYNMKATPERIEIGVIAQEVEKVLPEAVSVVDPENGYLGVSYPSLIPVLIEAVKELKAQNEELRHLVCLDHPEAPSCQ